MASWVAPYLITTRKFAYRAAVGSLPIAGGATFLQVLSGEWVATLIQLSQLLGEGIDLADLDAFLKAEAGIVFMHERSRNFQLTRKAVMLIPFGWVALQLVHDVEKDAAGGCGHMMACMVGAPVLAGKVGTAVWQCHPPVQSDLSSAEGRILLEGGREQHAAVA